MGDILLNMWAMYNQRQKRMIDDENERRARREEGKSAAGEKGERGGDPAPPHPATRGEKEEGEEEPAGVGSGSGGKADEEEEEEEEDGAPCPEPCDHSEGEDDDAPECDEIVRLAVRVQNRPKRKYYKISKIFLIGIAAKFRSIMLSWWYECGRFGRRIERFLASLAAAPD